MHSKRNAKVGDLWVEGVGEVETLAFIGATMIGRVGKREELFGTFTQCASVV